MFTVWVVEHVLDMYDSNVDFTIHSTREKALEYGKKLVQEQKEFVDKHYTVEDKFKPYYKSITEDENYTEYGNDNSRVMIYEQMYE